MVFLNKIKITCAKFKGDFRLKKLLHSNRFGFQSNVMEYGK